MFDKALEFVLEREGGYVNDPDDPGGATNFGITQAEYDRYTQGTGTTQRGVEHITQQQVHNIYYQKYWIGGQCLDLHWPFSLMHFDACVNLGKPEDGFKRSIKILQRAAEVRADGILGPITIKAINEDMSQALIEDYCWLRLRYYVDISRKRKILQKFLPGWVIRIQHLRKKAIDG